MRSASALAGACLVAGPAVAFEPLTVGRTEIAPSIDVYLSYVNDPDGVGASFGYVDFTLTLRRPVGSLAFGIEFYSGGSMDTTAEQQYMLYKDPYVDVGVWLESESFGYLSFGYDSSAIGAMCVEAPYAGQNFGPGDYVTVGTCPCLDTQSVLFYRTPDVGEGLAVGISYMPRTGLESVAGGEIAESVSLALSLNQDTANGAQWTGSLGIETAMEVEGGGPSPRLLQAGVNWAQDGWQIGGAASMRDNGDGSRDRAFALGVSIPVDERLTVSAGLNLSQSRQNGARLDETSVSVIGQYAIGGDDLFLDAGVWRIQTDDAGAQSGRTIVAIGFARYF